MAFDWKEENGVAVLVGYCGDAPFVEVPEQWNGLVVREIGERAFADCLSLQEVVLPKSLWTVANYSFAGCRNLKRVALPEGLKEAGAHAFYNCRSLAHLELPQGLQSVGDGFLKNCDSLKEVVIAEEKPLSPGVVSLLKNLDGRFLLTVKKKGFSLVFPAFDYEYAGNAPAMRFFTITHGAGERYRRSIETKGIDFAQYDRAFVIGVLEEQAETLLELVRERLAHPYQLEEEARRQYVLFCKQHLKICITFADQTGDLSFLELMEQEGILTKETVQAAVLAAAEVQNSAISAYLLDFQLKQGGLRKKKFEL